ncbi:cobalamin biosynthesis protein CbiX [Hylemonella gracilis str. Niagara R]|uniref:Cobalamin biosynthesis protein CbiX n=1 Tax=Hylemonella gracilis str. Niagara R TaxID=1458275 RepID=A0A016XGZ5_9BURK|nr:CbiX/SirB N-terminal domain-containing protein [Hylemonella gracilis]EYC51374.1 cobalamin biosynthesis protein CbiX [Hylemonella gracilis str. Niagara R]
MQGYILFAHGSRDPLWREPIEAVAARMREQLALSKPSAAAPRVACAYLELMAPTLPACVDDLAAQGVREFTIVPMFLGQGRHAREDLPELIGQLRAQHPELRFAQRPAVGEDPEIVDTLARLILR